MMFNFNERLGGTFLEVESMVVLLTLLLIFVMLILSSIIEQTSPRYRKLTCVLKDKITVNYTK